MNRLEQAIKNCLIDGPKTPIELLLLLNRSPNIPRILNRLIKRGQVKRTRTYYKWWRIHDDS